MEGCGDSIFSRSDCSVDELMWAEGRGQAVSDAGRLSSHRCAPQCYGLIIITIVHRWIFGDWYYGGSFEAEWNGDIYVKTAASWVEHALSTLAGTLSGPSRFPDVY